jgi:hypothetical protein
MIIVAKIHQAGQDKVSLYFNSKGRNERNTNSILCAFIVSFVFK